MELQFPLAKEPDDFTREAGRKLFAFPVEFLKGVVAMSGLPPADRIEVCFAGRSNAGKSSALNVITSQRGLARISKTPGRTQLINFFECDEERRLVDLPGYGFAKVNIKIKKLLKPLLEYRKRK